MDYSIRNAISLPVTKNQDSMTPYIPTIRDPVNKETLWNWYQNINIELNEIDFTESEKNHLTHYYTEAGLLKKSRRRFFEHHYSSTFSDAASLLLDHDSPHTLDLGAGCGTQALFLALHGSDITAVDTDGTALSVLSKRLSYYQNRTETIGDISIINKNAFEIDYSKIPTITGIYSMFAFNMMQPTKKLLNLILPHLSPVAKFAIIDGNNLCWYNRFIPSRRRNTLNKYEMESELKKHSLEAVSLNGGVSLPPILWSFLPNNLCKKVDSILCESDIFPISYQILAQRDTEK